MKLRTALFAVVCVTVAASLYAQPGPGAGGRGQCGRHAGGPPAYDLTAETTLSGKVVEVLPQSCPHAGLHVRLTTAAGELEVALGPSAFLAELGASFAVGDEIRVTGAKPQHEAPADFLARSVTKGDVSFELRDAAGKPRWTANGSCAMRGRQGDGSTD